MQYSAVLPRSWGSVRSLTSNRPRGALNGFRSSVVNFDCWLRLLAALIEHKASLIDRTEQGQPLRHFDIHLHFSSNWRTKSYFNVIFEWKTFWCPHEFQCPELCYDVIRQSRAQTYFGPTFGVGGSRQPLIRFWMYRVFMMPLSTAISI